MLSRKFFSNKIWEAARTFSECEAWLFLIQAARFEATDKTERIGDREITYGRGQYPASIRFLAKKWRWSERSVRTFLSKLVKERMITTDNSQGMNVITLCKYDEYNGGTANDTTTDTANNNEIRELKEMVTQLMTQVATQGRHTGDTNSNKEEKRKEDILRESKTEAAKAAALKRKKEFYDSLVPFVRVYGKEMTRKFFDYWSEMNKSGTKMRFELQKTWELGLRLSKWNDKEKISPAAKSNFANFDNDQHYEEF